MRSVIITNSYGELGGGELVLLAHLRHLVKEGVRVHLVLIEPGPLVDLARAEGANVTLLPFAWQGGKLRSLKLILRRVMEFRRLILNVLPNLVIAYTFTDLVLAGTAARLACCPVLYRAQGELWLPGRSQGATWLGPLLLPFFRIVRPRIVCTTRVQMKAMAVAGIPPELLAHVYLGVRKKLPSAEATVTANNPPVVGIFGRLVRWKGQDVFINALGQLARDGLAFRALVVGGSSFGDGKSYEDELHALAAKNHVEHSVEFLGFRNDVEALMQGCDVVCHCSRFEPFGMVIIEAMMLGKTVVASDVSGPRESVIDGVTGLLIPPDDAPALAAALARILCNPDLRIRMGEAARRRADAEFDLHRNFERLDAECERAVSRRWRFGGPE
jgi:glycosyltransferase involved in cell wall biosynthesis